MSIPKIRFLNCSIIGLLFLLGCTGPAAETTPTIRSIATSPPTPVPPTITPQIEAQPSESEWLALGSLQETVSRILAAQDFDVFVETSDGNLFNCKTYKAANGEYCWQSINAIPTLNDWVEQDCYQANHMPAQSFDSELAQMLVVTDSAEDVFIQSCFALLEDNTIWKADCGGGEFFEYPPTIAPELRVDTTTECTHRSASEE